MMSAVAAEAASDLVRKAYPVCTADANAVWSCSFGALGASRASSPGASGWCGCIRPVQSSENTVMEHLPQRGNVGCCVLFHTPRLCHKSRVFFGARLTSERHWTARACQVAAGREAVVGARQRRMAGTTDKIQTPGEPTVRTSPKQRCSRREVPRRCASFGSRRFQG